MQCASGTGLLQLASLCLPSDFHRISTASQLALPSDGSGNNSVHRARIAELEHFEQHQRVQRHRLLRVWNSPLLVLPVLWLQIGNNVKFHQLPWNIKFRTWRTHRTRRHILARSLEDWGSMEDSVPFSQFHVLRYFREYGRQSVVQCKQCWNCIRHSTCCVEAASGMSHNWTLFFFFKAEADSNRAAHPLLQWQPPWLTDWIESITE